MIGFEHQRNLHVNFNIVNSEYNTTAQKIGDGSFAGIYTITPSITAKSITDGDVQSELINQITTGKLPSPALDAKGNPITYYAVFFPNGTSIALGSYQSCVHFCAYHGTVAASVSYNQFYYAVQPDYSVGTTCGTGVCGSGTAFENTCLVASHELVEMITDSEVGIGSLAWYSDAQGEIGDICAWNIGTYAACDGQTYRIQKEHSNAAGVCVDFGVPSCPTSKPSAKPTSKPTAKPTTKPTINSTRSPSRFPSGKPSRSPSKKPSFKPSRKPL